MTKFEQPSGLLMIATAPGCPPWTAEVGTQEAEEKAIFRQQMHATRFDTYCLG